MINKEIYIHDHTDTLRKWIIDTECRYYPGIYRIYLDSNKSIITHIAKKNSWLVTKDNNYSDNKYIGKLFYNGYVNLVNSFNVKYDGYVTTSLGLGISV